VAAVVCLGALAGAEAEERVVVAVVAPGGGVAPAGAGARLRAGIAALEGGDAGQAARLFAAVVDDHPIVADHAHRLWLKALLELSHYATAAHLASGFEVAYPDSPLRGEVLRLLGDARAALAAPAAARAAWRRARREARDEETRAALDLSIAESFDRSGRAWEASQAYLAVWTEAPTSEAAKTAEEALKRLEGRSGRSLRTPFQLVKRARAFYAARANQEALATYDLAIDGNLPRNTRRELQRERNPPRLREGSPRERASAPPAG
jgi:tetratricopeptide (TPR) repeat protein